MHEPARPSRAEGPCVTRTFRAARSSLLSELHTSSSCSRVCATRTRAESSGRTRRPAGAGATDADRPAGTRRHHRFVRWCRRPLVVAMPEPGRTGLHRRPGTGESAGQGHRRRAGPQSVDRQPRDPPQPHHRHPRPVASPASGITGQWHHGATPLKPVAGSRCPRPKPRKIHQNPELRVFVQAGLDRRWSPEQPCHALLASASRATSTTAPPNWPSPSGAGRFRAPCPGVRSGPITGYRSWSVPAGSRHRLRVGGRSGILTYGHTSGQLSAERSAARSCPVSSMHRVRAAEKP